MSKACNICRGLRLPPGAAVIVLSALLLCSEIAATAHAEIDCEHDSCSLCIGSAGDSAPVAGAPPPMAPLCRRCVKAVLSTNARPPFPPAALFIRGPPAT